MATLYVGSSQTYQTIADAVEAANVGDTIIVKGSEYTQTDERVRVDKSLTLRAEGEVTLRGMNIGGNNFDVVIDGFNFVADVADANGVTGYEDNASCISQIGQLRNVTVTNCNFDLSNAGSSRTYGMYLSLGTWGFENLTVTGNTCSGILTEEDWSGYGLIYAAYVNNADISGNTVSDVAANAIQLSLTGVKYQGDGEQTVVIDGNIVTNVSASAIYCADLHNSNMTVAINNNVISDVQKDSCGIYTGAIRIGASTISGVEITNNIVEGAQVGIYNAAAIKEGSDGTCNISGNAIAVSQIHPAEDGVTPVFSALGGNMVPEGAADLNMIVSGTNIRVETSCSKIFVNNTWASYADGTKVAANGKILQVGTNAFAEVNDEVRKLVADRVAKEVVFAAGEYDKMAFDGNVIVKANTTGDEVVQFDLVDNDDENNPANTVTFASGNFFFTGKPYGTVFNPNDTYIVKSGATVGVAGQYMKSTILVEKGGVMNLQAMQNTVNPFTVKGIVNISDSGTYAKLAGNDNGTSGSMIIDGKNGEGIVNVAMEGFSVAGGYNATGWFDNLTTPSTLTITNGGLLKSNALYFRNGKQGTITIAKNSSMIFTSKDAVENQGTIWAERFDGQNMPDQTGNDGVIKVLSGSTLDLRGDLDPFVNAGTIEVNNASMLAEDITNNGMSCATITVDNSTLVAQSVSNSGSFIVKGASTLEIRGFSGSSAIQVAGGAKLSGNIGSIEEGTGKVCGVNLNLGGTVALTDKANFIGEIQGDKLSIGKNYSGSLKVTTQGDATVVIAAGAVLDSNDSISGNVNLLGNITVNAAVFEAKVTGNKNIIVESGIVNLKADSVVNTITIGGSSKNGGTILESTVQNLTIKGDFSTVQLNNGGVIKTITIDGSVEHNPLFSDFCLDSFGAAAIRGKNNAELTVNSAIFNGNTIKKVTLNLTDVNVEDGVKLDIDNLANLKRINGVAVAGNATAGYSIKIDDVFYTIADANADGLVFTAVKDDEGNASDNIEITDYTGSLIGFTSDYVVEAKTGTTTLKVNKGEMITIASITKNENGGVTNLNLNGNLTLGTLDNHGSVEAFGTITTGKDVEIKLGEVSGTNLNSKISLGKNNEATFDHIDMKGGKNTLSIGANSYIEVDDSDNDNTDGFIKNVKTINLASGTYKKATKTAPESIEYTILDVTGDIIAPAMANNITLGNYAKLLVTGDLVNDDLNVGTTFKVGNYSEVIFGEADGKGGVTGGEITSLSGLTIGTESVFKAAVVGGTTQNNIISFGKDSDVAVFGGINLLFGNDTIITGTNATVKVGDDIKGVEKITLGAKTDLVVDGDIIGVNKLTTGNGAYDKKNDLITWTSIEGGDVTGTEKNDTVSFGNYNDIVLASLDLGAGNDTLKIGINSIVNLNVVDFGDGKNTMIIGKNAKVRVTSIDGLDTINASKGASIWFASGADVEVDLTGIAGSWKNATIFDDMGEIANGDTRDGAVYGNEWDIYELTDGITKVIIESETNFDTIYRIYEKGAWDKAVVEITDITGEFINNLDASKDYVLAVSVEGADFKNKENDTNKYSFSITLA